MIKTFTDNKLSESVKYNNILDDKDMHVNRFDVTGTQSKKETPVRPSLKDH